MVLTISSSLVPYSSSLTQDFTFLIRSTLVVINKQSFKKSIFVFFLFNDLRAYLYKPADRQVQIITNSRAFFKS